MAPGMVSTNTEVYLPAQLVQEETAAAHGAKQSARGVGSGNASASSASGRGAAKSSSTGGATATVRKSATLTRPVPSGGSTSDDKVGGFMRLFSYRF